MKRWTALLLCLIAVFALCACGKENPETPETGTTAAPTLPGNQYTGEWNANMIASNIDEVRFYKTSVLILDPDGTGTYQGQAGTWYYNEEAETVAFTLADPVFTMVFTVSQDKHGVTVLQYYDDSYYRPEDFEPRTNPTEAAE